MEILVVDRSAISRRFIREELRGGGYTVLESDNGADGLRLFQERHPALVTLSVEMPGRSGFDLCESMRALESVANARRQVESVVPVLFVTANDTLQGRERGFAAGATDFLLKPFGKGRLLETVDTILKPKPAWADLWALLAEDSALTRHIVSSALRRFGVQVLEARDGGEALELARRHAERIAIIVSDLNMPHLGGQELCRRVRRMEALRDVPFIVLSVASEREAVLGLFREGATDYLIKPFSLEELLARIKVHLDACLLARDLERRNAELGEELRLASVVQRATLHDRCEVPHVRKATCYLPQGEVSGDVYDFARTARGDLRVFVGDATGHGVGAAFMTMMVQTGLDGIGPEQPLETTLTRLHRLLYERSGERFVTGVYASVARDGRLVHASAGHPPIVHVPMRGEPRLLDGEGGLPLGMLEQALPFQPQQSVLVPGDRLYLYTDGLTEWSRADGRQFSLERLLQRLDVGRSQPLQASVEGAVQAARTFAAGAPCGDDLTLVGLEYTP